MVKEGERVVAISHGVQNEKKLFVFGRGVYEGLFPIEDNEPAGWMARKASKEKKKPVLNPRMRLDSGKTVWGCECWWGPEATLDRYKEAGFRVEEIDIDEHRKTAAVERFRIETAHGYGPSLVVSGAGIAGVAAGCFVIFALTSTTLVHAALSIPALVGGIGFAAIGWLNSKWLRPGPR